MNIKRFTRIIPVLFIGLLLTACGSSIAPGSWPGITMDSDSGTAYVAFNQAAYALQTDNGAERWHFPAEKPGGFTTFAPPQLTEDGQLLVSGYDHLLYSLNPANGNTNWSFAGASNRFIGNPLAAKGTFYAPNSDGKLYALDAEGNLMWTFGTRQPLWSQPVLVGDVLVLASMDHNVYGVDPANGDQLWSFDAGGALVSTPAVGENGMVYVGTLNQKVLAIDSARGQAIWTYDTPGWVWGSPTYFEGTLYLGDLEGSVIALNATTGRELWNVKTEGAVTGAPLVSNDHIYVVNESGQVISFTPDGTIQWTKGIEAALYGSVVADGDLILVGVGKPDALVTALDENGDTVWTFAPAAQK